MSAAAYSIHGKVAVITFNNLPMNTLAHAMRVAVLEQLQQALGDASVKAIVLIGGGRAFCSGAEIREFNTPRSVASPNVRELIAAIEGAPKPVIAAIHGVAMGGGLELAMGCHYRVVSPGTQLALPEVKLGLLPGASGTQRLPRLIGVEAALNMIVSGNTVVSDKLADTALIDELVQGDLLAGALAFAGRLLAANKPIRRVRHHPNHHPPHTTILPGARRSGPAQRE